MMAFENLEPFGAFPAEARSAQIAATIANVNRDPDKRAQPFTPRDFSRAIDAEIDRAEDAEIARMTPEERIAAIDRALFKV